MILLLQQMTLFLQRLLFINLLILNEFPEKTAFAPDRVQAASALAYGAFSNSNTQGYPQE
ncbi:hypothetical protein BS412_08715 [Cronobacter turicensis]|uniref:Uncharacterized protein n=1 Tax=Cronobacter turicensis TaxID=413502 RepID=A0A2T7AYS3_9ENTR|nr:hypothetical protein [Cronobacter turicensis]NCH22364.1 hypothetical protein [Cronobacter turicensis]PUX17729.1 hypothetical protein BS411_20035 [Cronobacter turicensis]PUX37088.1 hypothetical protein BS412_08715 [Cronobacter turicensis]